MTRNSQSAAVAPKALRGFMAITAALHSPDEFAFKSPFEDNVWNKLVPEPPESAIERRKIDSRLRELFCSRDTMREPLFLVQDIPQAAVALAGTLGPLSTSSLPMPGGEKVLRSQIPFFQPSSLEFSDDHGARELEEYLIVGGDAGAAYYNDFIVLPDGSTRIGSGAREDYKAAFDLLLLCAYRRAALFKPEFSARLYYVCLPPARLQSHREQEHTYLGVPILSLYRKPRGLTLRKLLAVNLILVPVDKSYVRPRTFGNEELQFMLRREYVGLQYPDGVELELDGELRTYLGPQCSACVSVHNLLESILLGAIDRLVLEPKDRSDTLRRVFSSSRHSRIASAYLVTPTATESEITAWNKGAISPIEATLRTIVTLGGAVSAEWQRSLDIRKLRLNDDYGFDSHLAIFFNPETSCVSLLMSEEAERFPASSVKWALPWGVIGCTGLASLREMVSSFHHEIERNAGLESLFQVTSEFVEDFDEFYDLDLVMYNYKGWYQRLKVLDGSERDYAKLKEKMTALNEQLSMKAQVWLAVLNLILAVVAVLAAVFAIFLLEKVSLFTKLLFAGFVALGLAVGLFVRQLLLQKR
jgi:hypothetical protein